MDARDALRLLRSSYDALGAQRPPRRQRGVLLLLLCASLTLNFQLGLALLPSLLSLLFLPFNVGIPLAVLFASVSNIPDAARTTPWAPTPSDDLRALLAHAERRGLFLDLGCGDGRTLLLALREGFARAVGVELSPALAAASRLRLQWEGFDAAAAAVHTADVLSVALPAEADCVYVYLSVEALAQLAPRLACAYGGGRVTVLSRDFALPGWGEPTTNLTRGRTTLLAYDARRVDQQQWSCPRQPDPER